MVQMTALVRQFYNRKLILSGQNFEATDSDADDLVAIRHAIRARPGMGAPSRAQSVPAVEKNPITTGNTAEPAPVEAPVVAPVAAPVASPVDEASAAPKASAKPLEIPTFGRPTGKSARR